jgi:hypothetical protein
MLTFIDVRLVVGVESQRDWSILGPYIGSLGVILFPAFWSVFDPEGSYAL